jgi:UDP-N-acetylmuramoyl-tripeptide--D-alanyl-D-alanine ligase
MALGEFMEVTWKLYETWLGDQLVEPHNILKTTALAPHPSHWSTDSRSLEPGQWFVPLKGPHFDGHRYIADIIAKGAAGFLYQEEEPVDLSLQALGIRVKNTLMSYQKIALGWRKSLFDLRLIAITGSNGKTTTKEILAKILRDNGPTLATESNFNNEIGVPKTLLNLLPEHRYAVVEFGARFPGNIKELVEIGSPDITCLLNAGMAHVGIFGSVEKLRDTKLEIFRNLRSGGTQIVPYDDPIILREALKLSNHSITFGTHPLSDVRLGPIAVDRQFLKTKFEIYYQGQRYPIDLNSTHKIMGINCAAAFAMGIACEIPPAKIATSLQNFPGVKGRFQVSTHFDFVLIDDSYNANPNSMAAGLESLQSLGSQRPLILFLGDMLELGDLAVSEHQRIGHIAAMLNPLQLHFIGSHANDFKKGALDASAKSGQIYCYNKVEDLLETIQSTKPPWSCKHPIIYVKASRGIRLDRIVELLQKLETR